MRWEVILSLPCDYWSDCGLLENLTLLDGAFAADLPGFVFTDKVAVMLSFPHLFLLFPLALDDIFTGRTACHSVIRVINRNV